jgi:DNA-directed RNA polymerase specialized sigma54-like protein
MKILQELHLEAIKDIGDDWEDSLDKTVLTDYFDKKQAASKSAEITEQIAIEFAEWIDNKGYLYHPAFKVWMLTNKKFTSEQLFQEFLKTRI